MIHSSAPEYMSGVEDRQFPFALRAFNYHYTTTPLQADHFPLHSALTDTRNTTPLSFAMKCFHQLFYLQIYAFLLQNSAHSIL